MIIDAHAHACGVFLKGESIVETLDRCGAAKVVLVPGELGSDKNRSLPDLAARFPNSDVVSLTNFLTKMIVGLAGAAKDIGEGNAYVHSLAREYPDRIIQFYWVMLSRPSALKDLERHYEEYGFKGIKLHQCWESFKVGGDTFHQVAQWAAAKNLPIFVHLYSRRQAAKLAEYMKAHPNTVFIIAHLFGLQRYIASGIRSDNIFLDISPPPLVSRQRLNRAIQHFGAQRVVLGSDTPFGRDNLQRNIERVRSLDIPEADKDRILGLNMKDLLGL